MYSVSVPYNDHKSCCESGRLCPSVGDYTSYEKVNVKKNKDSQGNTNKVECEFAHDAISLDLRDTEVYATSLNNRLVTVDLFNPYITVDGKEELPCIQKYYLTNTSQRKTIDSLSSTSYDFNVEERKTLIIDKINRNTGRYLNKNGTKEVFGYCTLPKTNKRIKHSKLLLRHIIPPKRITPDGTHIYYLCDLNKKENDGKY